MVTALLQMSVSGIFIQAQMICNTCNVFIPKNNVLHLSTHVTGDPAVGDGVNRFFFTFGISKLQSGFSFGLGI